MEITISKRFYDEFDRGAKNSYIYISPSLSNPASFNKACRGGYLSIYSNFNAIISMSTCNSSIFSQLVTRWTTITTLSVSANRGENVEWK